MSQERVARLNEFARHKHPGLVGVELEICEADLVTGKMTVTEPVIAGTGFLWAPVVITLADWLCAAGMSPNLPEGASFTTVELKTNFLGSATEGEIVSGRAVPVHRGKSTHVWDVEVRNETKNRVIALFRCTQMILYPKP
ncbi:PaaI family thioesterase [Parvibaculum sp.]|uniref:PaaI family thioesterase n=1 Tax=Parvibaculum sp. TaxID=2024848 RepID=UPI002B89E5CB|nr:PaaI family thioesterase [Parvibaculum sp.]HUD52232.1 PaaI family thioesterase [Parvibaculum sp.]